MKISLEEKKAEAVKRMKAYGLFHEAIECFEHDGIVMYSEAPWGCYYAVDDNLKKEINKFEKEHNALVYTVVRSYHRELGMIDSLLYVSDEKDEWWMDWGDIKNKCPCTQTVNYDNPDFTEIGAIGVKLGAGAGLIRIS